MDLVDELEDEDDGVGMSAYAHCNQVSILIYAYVFFHCTHVQCICVPGHVGALHVCSIHICICAYHYQMNLMNTSF